MSALQARFAVHLTPRAARDALDGWAPDARGPRLRARVSAPPVSGRANAALVRLLAGALGVPPAAVRVRHGQAARDKQIAVDGLTLADVHARLGGPHL